MENASRGGSPYVVREPLSVVPLKPSDVLAAVRVAFAGLAAGDSLQPPQCVSPLAGRPGDVITYFGILGKEDVFGVKLSPYFPSRTDGPKVTAWTVLFSMSTGEPLLVCDSYTLTAERTAATTMLALDYLVPTSGKSLTIVGAGKIGIAHLRHALALRKWASVRMFSPRLVRDPSLFQSLVQELGEKIEVAESMEQAVRTSDVVLLCTSAADAIVNQDWVRNGSIITSVSTNAKNAHEVPPDALANWEVFCDYRATTPTIAGEMVLAASRYGWSPEAILADLSQLVAGTGRHPTGRAPIFFRSVGLGIEDMALANLVLRRLGSNCISRK